MENGQNPINPFGIFIDKRLLQSLLEEAIVFVFAFSHGKGLLKAKFHHHLVAEIQFAVIKRSTERIETKMVQIEEVRRDQIVADFLIDRGHAAGKEDDVFLFHVFPTGEEIIDSLDLAAFDPTAIHDRVIVIEIHFPEFFLVEFNRFRAHSERDFFRIGFRAARGGGVKN